MSFKNSVVVIAGATGTVASGAVRRYLDEGATVVGISRDGKKLAALKDQMKIGPKEPFHGVVGDFLDDATAAKTRADVLGVLAGKPIDHVISGLGFVTMAQAATKTPTKLVHEALNDGLFNTVLLGQAFLPLMKGRPGATFTMLSGGLAHGLPPFVPNVENMWLATLKNAAVNALTYGFAAETGTDGVRVNTVCIHFGVARPGGKTNQFGMPAEGDTVKLASAFTRLASGTSRGQVICLTTWDDVEKVAQDPRRRARFGFGPTPLPEAAALTVAWARAKFGAK